VVRIVRAGVVLGRMDAVGAPDRSDGAPREVGEIDEQVGCNAVLLVVDVLGAKDARPERLAVGAAERSQLVGELRADALVVLRRNRALGLAVAHVEEDPPVVAAVAPGGRRAPVDARLGERHRGVGLRQRAQIALAAQPFVDADPALHPLRAVVGGDEDRGVVVRMLEQRADELVDVTVVVEDRVGVRTVGVEVLPERVVHAVDPHLDHCEELPRLRAQQVVGQSKAAIGHVVDLAE
jgi:hypothetical protein